MNINWKSESTYAAIGGGLVAVLTATGLLIASEGEAASAVIANLAAGVVGLITLIRAVRNRTKSGEGK